MGKLHHQFTAILERLQSVPPPVVLDQFRTKRNWKKECPHDICLVITIRSIPPRPISLVIHLRGLARWSWGNLSSISCACLRLSIDSQLVHMGQNPLHIILYGSIWFRSSEWSICVTSHSTESSTVLQLFQRMVVLSHVVCRDWAVTHGRPCNSALF